MEPLDIPESITKKEMVLVLRHWHPIFRASVLRPPVEIVVPKRYTTHQLLHEQLKPLARSIYKEENSTNSTVLAEKTSASQEQSPADATATNCTVSVEDDADYEVAKWSQFFGNLNGASRAKTIRKLAFAGVSTG